MQPKTLTEFTENPVTTEAAKTLSTIKEARRAFRGIHLPILLANTYAQAYVYKMVFQNAEYSTA